MKKSDGTESADSCHPEVGPDETRRYRCDICEIWANSEKHLKNHKEGKAHRKKENQLRNGVVSSPGEPVWFECPICNKQVNSQQQLDIHVQSHELRRMRESMNHARKRERLDTSLDGDNARLYSPSLATNNLNIPGTTIEKIHEKHPAMTEHFFSCNSSTNSDYSLNSGKLAKHEDVLKPSSSHKLINEDETPLWKVWTPEDDDDDDKMKQRNISKPRKLLCSQDHDSDDEVKLTVGPKSTEHGSTSNSSLSASTEKLLCNLVEDLSISYKEHGQPPEIISRSRSGFYCNLCKIPLTGVKPKEQHELSSKHTRNVAIELYKSQAQVIREINDNFIISLRGNSSPMEGSVLASYEAENNPFPHHYSYCRVCNVPFTSPKNREDHLNGKKHNQLAKLSEKVPARELPKILKCDKEAEDEGFDLTKTVPRFYQHELYLKAMESDTVCFLPTGTGKTLTSIMVMSYMLKLNPERPVVFLVDRVLLVLQQSKYIERELQESEFKRIDHDTGKLVSRKLLIAALCGQQQDVSGHAVPLWKHDIIVSTAEYLRNLLERRSLRWSDMSLVILDEVHHCTKEHPYNTLLRDHHKVLQPSERPKILGLTASPAGRKSVELTEIMLRELLVNLGGAKLAIVSMYIKDLKRHQSTATLEVKEVTMSPEEKILMSEFRNYLKSCYEKLQDFIEFDKKDTDSLTEGDEDDIHKFVNVLKTSLKNPKMRSAGKELDADLSWHVVVICNAFLSLMECGIEAALEEIECLLEEDYPGNFDKIKEQDLSCQQLERRTRRHVVLKSKDAATSRFKTDVGPAVSTLLDYIHSQIDCDGLVVEGENRPVVLVLVKERSTTKFLERILKEDHILKQHNVNIIRITGHGSGKIDDGMTVAQQKKALEDIKKKLYQIIVATSVAEEGLDLPECELVIEMDPPNTVTSLIQIRGRARKKNGRFIAICRKEGAKEKIEDLLERERYMEEACRKIMERQSS